MISSRAPHCPGRSRPLGGRGAAGLAGAAQFGARAHHERAAARSAGASWRFCSCRSCDSWRGRSPGRRSSANRVPLGRAVAATISGDALGNVTPLSLLVSEPVKAMYLDAGPGSSRSLAALTAENFLLQRLGRHLRHAGHRGDAPRVSASAGEIHVAGVTALGLMAVRARRGRVDRLAEADARERGPLAAAVRPAHGRSSIVSATFEIQTYGSAGRQGGRLGVVFVCEADVSSPQLPRGVAHVWLVTGVSVAARRLRPRHVQPRSSTSSRR